MGDSLLALHRAEIVRLETALAAATERAERAEREVARLRTELTRTIDAWEDDSILLHGGKGASNGEN